MGKQDDYTRITLRLPAEVHGQLNAVCERTKRSMNAEIIRRLEVSLAEDAEYKEIAEDFRKDDGVLKMLIDKIVSGVVNVAIRRAFEGGADGEPIEKVYQDIRESFNLGVDIDDRAVEIVVTQRPAD